MCSLNTCAHGGTCTSLSGQTDLFHCECPPGFTGNNTFTVKKKNYKNLKHVNFLIGILKIQLFFL